MSSDPGNPPGDWPKPWHRQPCDTKTSFHAFMHYRDLPSWTRSIDAAYREHREQCLNADKGERQNNGRKASEGGSSRAPRGWQNWSSANDWVERVAQYDEFRAEERRRRREQELSDALDETVRIAKSGLARVAQRLIYMGPDEIPAGQLDRWIKNLTEVQLRALGYEQRVGVELAGPDGGPIPVEQEVDWGKLLADPAMRQALETLGMAADEVAAAPEPDG